MIYNPITGEFEAEPPKWWGIINAVDIRISTAARKRDTADMTFHLNVMDLLDPETAAWWRGAGLSLWSKCHA